MILRILLLIAFLLSSSPAFAGTDWTDSANGCVNTYLMDDASGDVVDSCGSNDLSAAGNPTYTQTGQFGTSITLDGNDYFSADQADVTATPMTFVVWFKPDNETENFSAVWVGDKDSTDEWSAINYGGSVTNDPVRAISFSNAAGFKEANKTNFDTSFEHAAAVYASNSSRIAYLNGVAGTAETTTVDVLGEDRTAIGINADSSPSSGAKGDVDEVGIFDVELDGTDINDIMTNGLVQVAGGRTRRFF